MADSVIVIKRNLAGEETWRYSGQVLERGQNYICLEAYFNRPDTPFHGILLGQGDRFLESFYNDRWYNYFEMHARLDGSLKGWYCNITRPAEIEPGQVSYIDLALDLLVYPDGSQMVLDEDEFAALNLDADTRQQALTALTQLQELFIKGQIRPMFQ